MSKENKSTCGNHTYIFFIKYANFWRFPRRHHRIFTADLHATGQLEDSGRRAQKDEKMSRETVHSRSCATFFRHSAVRSLPAVLLREVSNQDDDGPEMYNTRTKQMCCLYKAIGFFLTVYCSTRWRRGLLKLVMLNSLCYHIALRQYYHLLYGEKWLCAAHSTVQNNQIRVGERCWGSSFRWVKLSRLNKRLFIYIKNISHMDFNS